MYFIISPVTSTLLWTCSATPVFFVFLFVFSYCVLYGIILWCLWVIKKDITRFFNELNNQLLLVIFHRQPKSTLRSRILSFSKWWRHKGLIVSRSKNKVISRWISILNTMLIYLLTCCRGWAHTIDYFNAISLTVKCMIIVNFENMKTLLLQIDWKTVDFLLRNCIVSALCELNFGEKIFRERTLTVKVLGKLKNLSEFVANDLNMYLEMLYSMFLKDVQQLLTTLTHWVQQGRCRSSSFTRTQWHFYIKTEQKQMQKMATPRENIGILAQATATECNLTSGF